MRTLVWFRGKDLRLSDHEPLSAALSAGDVIPLFVLDPYFFAPERAERFPARIQFLLDSLRALSDNVAHLGSRLLVVPGKSVDVVPELARRWKVDRVVGYRWTEPLGRERDRRVRERLSIPFDLFEGETLAPPASVRTGSGDVFSVFTPFARAFLKTVTVGAVIRPPKALPPIPADVTATEVAIPKIEDLGISRNEALQVGGERAGRDRLRRFLRSTAATYKTDRDRMDRSGTSRLSADIKFGTVSIRTVWNEAEAALSATAPEALSSFRNELLWREFSHGILFDRPEVLSEPFRRNHRGFPYRVDDSAWEAWVFGRTGYPVVDAAARQLLAEGFVHNRARMVAASFLTKNLLIDYKRGEAHYMKHLVDGDWAQNNMGWQWCAGSGPDAQPYFRVFNPVLQGQRFDPEGAYVRRWVPELASLPAKHIHHPWDASAEVLRAAGVTLGVTYPEPVVDYAASRARYLAIAQEHLHPLSTAEVAPARL